MNKIVKCFFVTCCVVAASLSVNLASNAALPFFSGDKNEVPSLAPMLDKVTPAIVSISVEGTQVSRQRVPENFKRFFGGSDEQVQERPFKGLGSGVIIDAKKMSDLLSQFHRNRVAQSSGFEVPACSLQKRCNSRL